MGELISCPLLPERVLHAGDHQFLHNPFNEGGLSRSYGSHHSNVNIAAGPGGDVCINPIHASLLFRQERAPAMGLPKGMSPVTLLEPQSFAASGGAFLIQKEHIDEAAPARMAGFPLVIAEITRKLH